ncbi:MAG: N-acetylmuramoyl-L-alanine amidase [Alphaproteobacteria bacterium]|nr:N-acetylmuramoyl-L-alanine amidase [Alphaproteobacteria bacterium]
MKISRRDALKITGLSVVVAGMVPRMAFAARNALRSVRTGVQPGDKTRLVIETSTRPSYSLSYPEKQLVVDIANMSADSSVTPKLASGTLVSEIKQVQSGDHLQIVATLRKNIGQLQKSQIMLLEPNGDNDYRLVFDFTAASTSADKIATSVASSGTSTQKTKQNIIVIDPGHGGKDPGCIGRGGTKEKDIVLAVARRLKTGLDQAGFKTYMTRSGDKYLKLAERAEFAENRKGDLFISLHANANPSRSVKGFSIYTLSEKASDEEAKKLAESENAADKIGVDGFTEFERDIRAALSSLQQHAVAEMSEEYANGCAWAFRSSKVEAQPGPSVRHAPFAVLRSTVPGALIELGHLSNAAEEKLLKTPDHQNKLVAAIVRSIKNYNFDV